jgi:peptide chain release factor 2
MNRQLALRMLQAKLQQIEVDKETAKTAQAYGEKSEVAFGSQIRSYVFQPYQMVKDLRTGVQTSNVQAVMDGEIDPFIEGKLRGLQAGQAPGEEDDI